MKVSAAEHEFEVNPEPMNHGAYERALGLVALMHSYQADAEKLEREPATDDGSRVAAIRDRSLLAGECLHRFCLECSEALSPGLSEEDARRLASLAEDKAAWAWMAIGNALVGARMRGALSVSATEVADAARA